MDTPATLRTDTSRDRLRGLWPAIDTPVLLIGLVVLVLILTAPFGSLSQTMTEMMIRIVLVVGLYVFVGNSGILSFGHISFMSIGAYAFVWFSCCTLPMVKPLYLPGLPLFLQELALPSPVGIAAAAIIAGAAAFLIAAILMIGNESDMDVTCGADLYENVRAILASLSPEDVA